LSAFDIFILFGLGFVGGAVGAVAGGAGLFTLPAMLHVGLNPVVASASTFVALLPSGITAMAANRLHLKGTWSRVARILPTICVGSALGSLFLVLTPVGLFTHLFPFLLLIGTLLFALAPAIHRRAARRAGGETHIRRRPVVDHGALLAASCYGGFFAAGVGIVLLAALTLAGWNNVHQANAVKNFTVTVASVGSAVVLIVGDVVAWPQCLVAMAGGLVGGYAGGLSASRVNARVLRIVVITVGLSLTIYYGERILLGN